MFRYWDALLMRGWLVPERVATEGSHGTLAESEAQADLATLMADLLLVELVRHINWFLIDDLLALNFGEDKRGTVFVGPERLGADEQPFFRQLIQAILVAPHNAELARAVLDLGQIMDVAGLPKSDGDIDLAVAADEAAKRITSGELGLPASMVTVFQEVYQQIRRVRQGAA